MWEFFVIAPVTAEKVATGWRGVKIVSIVEKDNILGKITSFQTTTGLFRDRNILAPYQHTGYGRDDKINADRDKTDTLIDTADRNQTIIRLICIESSFFRQMDSLGNTGIEHWN